MNQELPTINGELLRLRRETRGWALSDLATRACMSVKQIRQLEEGGSSAFYSETVKWTSAKKVGSLLGMQPEEVFVQVAPEVLTPTQADAAVDAPTDVVTPALEAVAAPSESVSAGQEEPVAVAPDALAEATESRETPQTSKTPVLALAVLFIAALAVAAWMRPEPEVVTEPAPPVLQNMATEPSETASTPSAAVTTNVTASAATQAQKPASTALTAAASASATASVAAASASASRAIAPAASAASTAVAKPASTVQAPASAASAASKPL